MIYHFITATDFKARVSGGELRTASLESEGFIHCSTRDQYLERVNYLAPYSEEMQLLEIDESALASEVRYENTTVGGEEYPHVYGPIPLKAIINKYHLEWDGEEGYAAPEELG